MAKTPTATYRCDSCGDTTTRWYGRCPRCNAWGSLTQTTPAGGSAKPAGVRTTMTGGTVTAPARRVNDIDTAAHRHTPTGLTELDRVLGGGLVKGQVILLAGAPGVGKSTLLLACADQYAKQGRTVLYVSGEESAEQITLRARRTGVNADDLYLADETDLAAVLSHIEQTDPDLLIVDSIQTIASPDVDSRAGGVAQVQEVSAVLTRIAKARRMPTVIVGQITKEGSVAGPMTLAHAMDTVCEFTGDPHTSLRLLRTMKNRFGPADEVSCWEQTEDGIRQVADPSGLFLDDRDTPVAGTCVTVALEGRRPILAEIQALVAPTNAPNPRRGVSGLDGARMGMLVAVTERHARLRLYDKDTYLATVAGMRTTEPAVDLAACLALMPAALDLPLPGDVAAVGEVALSGDVRRASAAKQRLAEAARLGYRRVLVPPGTPTVDGLVTVTVPHLAAAVTALQQLAETDD